MNHEPRPGSVRVLIGSAGRRVYLIRWFKEALDALGLDGDVVVTENDTTSSSFAAADGAWPMPRYDDPSYRDAMREAIAELKPQLFFSVNDYELSALASGLAEELRQLGTIVLSLGERQQRVVEDKFAMARAFAEYGIATPDTVLASDAEGVRRIAGSCEEVVVKHRFGSGSSGLHLMPSSQVERAVALSVRTAPGGAVEHDRAEDLVVVQPRLPGDEYGVDIVAPLTGDRMQECEVLVRRKLRMRSGETDKAISVEAEPFRSLGRSIADVLRPQGLIDTDVMVGPDGVPMVIDVNPRFGGGYVFSHLAGADAPHYYLTQTLGLDTDPRWAEYESEVVAAKFEDAIVSGRSSEKGDDSR